MRRWGGEERGRGRREKKGEKKKERRGFEIVAARGRVGATNLLKNQLVAGGAS